VQDTGIGMSEEQCNNVFERFYKGNEFAQGTGLGLSICQNIATKMNGTISVTSKLGEGSCFSINFPCTIVNTTL
jgi:signal transduction histidine kinase